MIGNLLRKYLLKLKHPTAKCSKSAVINNVDFGEYTQVTSNASLSNTKLGDYSSVGRNTTINHADIGKFCSISWNVTIGATSHPDNHITTHAFPYISQFGMVKKNKKIKVKTIVGNDVWIGTNVVIMPGISIGNGAIIGAGSIVTKNVPDYAVVVGVPAKITRYRFTSQEINILSKLEWWNWPRERIKNNIELFKIPITESLLKKLKDIS
ncbi:CatB-related O-acetyltransferase [bacterium SCSIO 12643]|nr:CatB-related O-acetyltransferase [bacterium SCSIO 12643]